VSDVPKEPSVIVVSFNLKSKNPFVVLLIRLPQTIFPNLEPAA